MEQIKTVGEQRIKDVNDKYTRKTINRVYEIFKRIFDFVSSLIVSVIMIVPCIILIIIIFITDPGSPFFVQERMGKGGKPIRIVKFRSMVKNAEDLQSTLSKEEYERYLKEFKLENDPRLLPHNIGNLIRKLSVDELPQIFFNICVKGDMSVIGPRPILREELELNYTPEEQELLLSVKPGLTGYWQAYGRNNIGYATGARQCMELYYVRNRSAKADIKILIKTIAAVLKRSGAK